MEYNFKNEIEYIAIWCKLKEACDNPKVNKEIMEEINKRVAVRLNVLHVDLKEDKKNK